MKWIRIAPPSLRTSCVTRTALEKSLVRPLPVLLYSNGKYTYRKTSLQRTNNFSVMECFPTLETSISPRDRWHFRVLRKTTIRSSTIRYREVFTVYEKNKAPPRSPGNPKNILSRIPKARYNFEFVRLPLFAYNLPDQPSICIDIFIYIFSRLSQCSAKTISHYWYSPPSSPL